MLRAIRVTGLLLAGLGVMATAVPPASANVFVGVSVGIAPPPLPVYTQPYCPGAGYIWTPGYWAYGPMGYYWVPGTWVMPPSVGLLWTPGYWGWGGSAYFWHAGYWGPHVGFYGGINYGFGYPGSGFYGGAWRGGVYQYNTAVTNVNTTIIHNTYYNKTVINNVNTVNHVSYNGGHGGINSRPTSFEQSAARERRMGATSMQTQQEEAARGNRGMLASENHGRPTVAATQRAGEFQPQRGGQNGRNEMTPANRPTTSAPQSDMRRAREDRPPSARGMSEPNSNMHTQPATANANRPSDNRANESFGNGQANRPTTNAPQSDMRNAREDRPPSARGTSSPAATPAQRSTGVNRTPATYNDRPARSTSYNNRPNAQANRPPSSSSATQNRSTAAQSRPNYGGQNRQATMSSAPHGNMRQQTARPSGNTNYGSFHSAPARTSGGSSPNARMSGHPQGQSHGRSPR